jgi:quercetin dioxygenase-like cupin family protein
MTMPRREAIAACALLVDYLANAGDLSAQLPGTEAAQAGPVFRQDLPDLTMDGWEVTASHVDYAPGRVGAPHRHPGFVLVYVLSGEVIAKVSGQGEEKRYTAGQMFYEQPGATHEVSRNASATEPARILAMIFAKKGSTLTVPVDGGD